MGSQISCPVCGDDSIAPILEDITVTVSSRQGQHAVGALMALRCAEGHIFFVREADVQLLAA